MKFAFWKKDQVPQDGAYAPYEEIDAKRTSKLGYFFLVLMVLFGVIQGNNFLESVKDSVERPERISSCTQSIAHYAGVVLPSGGYGNDYLMDSRNSYSYDMWRTDTSPRYEDCVFSERERKVSLDTIYNLEIRPLEETRESLQTTLTLLDTQLSNAKNQRKDTVQDYQVSVIEDISEAEQGKPQGVFDSNTLGQGVVSQSEQIRLLEVERASTQSKIEDINNNLTRVSKIYTSALNTVADTYRSDVRMYSLKQFALTAVLVFPLFFLVWRRYNRYRLARSEYTVIWGGVAATFGLISAQILLTFVYEIIPHQIIEMLMNFLAMFEALWVLLYWLGFILVPLFFGFLIYLIQKKFYNKRAVMMRALKSGKCPQCSLHINHTMNACPICGYELKSKCVSCGGMSMSGGAFCEVCGVPRNAPQNTVPTHVVQQ
jgi:hypothetical protein